MPAKVEIQHKLPARFKIGDLVRTDSLNQVGIITGLLPLEADITWFKPPMGTAHNARLNFSRLYHFHGAVTLTQQE